MRGDGRLRQAAAFIDLSAADAEVGAVLLIGKGGRGVFQPVEDVSPYWVCQGFYYFVEVNGGHGSARVGYSVISR
ncbi:hypothetical protein D3C80_1934800 [compost metagenome]